MSNLSPKELYRVTELLTSIDSFRVVTNLLNDYPFSDDINVLNKLDYFSKLIELFKTVKKYDLGNENYIIKFMFKMFDVNYHSSAYINNVDYFIYDMYNYHKNNVTKANILSMLDLIDSLNKYLDNLTNIDNNYQFSLNKDCLNKIKLFVLLFKITMLIVNCSNTYKYDNITKLINRFNKGLSINILNPYGDNTISPTNIHFKTYSKTFISLEHLNEFKINKNWESLFRIFNDNNEQNHILYKDTDITYNDKFTDIYDSYNNLYLYIENAPDEPDDNYDEFSTYLS